MSFSSGDLHDKATKVKWYNKKWFMWCMLFLFWPVGVYLLYRHRDEYSTKKKACIAVGMCCFWIFAALTGPSNHPQSHQPAAQTAETSTTTESADSAPAEEKPAENTADTSKSETAASNSSSTAQTGAGQTTAATSATTKKSSSKAASTGSFNSESSYLGNPKKMIFHRPGCHTIQHPERFVSLSSRDEAVASGYRPCGVCNP